MEFLRINLDIMAQFLLKKLILTFASIIVIRKYENFSHR
jgi:hypothetical protein